MSLTTNQQRTALPGTATSVLLVGNWAHPEMAQALAGLTLSSEWPHVATVDEAADFLSQCESPPELILLAQPLPGRYSQNHIHRLQSPAPLTRIVLVAGTWCEGELRTGNVPHGVIRLYWYDLANWWHVAQRQLAVHAAPAWSQPLDHQQAGRWTSAVTSIPARREQVRVAIQAVDFETYAALSGALAEFRLDCVWHHPDKQAPPAVELGIWDGGQLSDLEEKTLTDFCQHVEGPVLALLDFPRVEHIEQAQAAGAAAVLAKPYILDELVASLLNLVDAPPQQPTPEHCR